MPLVAEYLLNKCVLCRQEGWRLEHEDIHNQASPISFKGVVFNEMKGALVSLPVDNFIVVYQLTLCLFPD